MVQGCYKTVPDGPSGYCECAVRAWTAAFRSEAACGCRMGSGGMKWAAHTAASDASTYAPQHSVNELVEQSL